MDKKGMGVFWGFMILLFIGFLVFIFAFFVLNNINDYKDTLENNTHLKDPDYQLGHTMEEKKEMIKNETIAPPELSTG